MARQVKAETRRAIEAQIADEISFARRYKQGKVSNWQKNEDLYYGNKKKTDDSRANVDLGQMQEHAHTILSKIDNPLTFTFLPRKKSQTSRVRRLNALKDYDAHRDFWDMKDMAGKKQMIIYGRAIFSYAASSHEGYQSHLEPVDVYDFLWDPSAGGLDLEKGRFGGRYGVVKDRSELKNNRRKDYIQDEIRQLLEGPGNATERTQEWTNKQNRVYANKHDQPQKQNEDRDKFVFWEWYTTYNGQRYYALYSETGGRAIKLVPLKEIFKSEMWPFFTYAAYPDLTEFWTPSPCDYVREIIMAQAVSINQMLDNAERVNRPMKVIDVSAVQNLAELKYRKDGYVKAQAGTAQAAVKIMETPSINTPITVFETLERIKQAASGVTAGAKGVEDTDGRATIYEGNQANVADRFGMFNKSYSFGTQRFGQLWELGVREHLKKKVAVEILGPDGVDVEMIGPGDLFRKGEEYTLITEQSNAELSLSEQKKRGQAAYFSALLGRADLANQKVVIEQLAAINGVEPQVIQQLLDVDEFGSAEVLAEADRDIEMIIDGNRNLEPNRVANTAYKQRFVDYLRDNQEHLDQETINRMVVYIRGLDRVIVSNMRRQAREQARLEMAGQQAGGTGRPPQLRQPNQSQPLQDVIQQNVPRQ